MTNEIFVFGSNLGGKHEGGSARHAYDNLGAEWGVGVGRTGACYAIPTLTENFECLPLETIANYVKEFLDYAQVHDYLKFRVVAIGCGIAGFTPEEIGPMFKGAPDNCLLPSEFTPYRKLRDSYASELELLEQQMYGAQAFAAKFPYFADKILFGKITQEFSGCFTMKYKDMPYEYGIHRRYFLESQLPHNMDKEEKHERFLWVVCLSQMRLFGYQYTDTGLDDICKQISVVHYSKDEEKFFVSDRQLMPLLDTLYDWWQKAKILNARHLVDLRYKELEAEMSRLNDQIKEVANVDEGNSGATAG